MFLWISYPHWLVMVSCLLAVVGSWTYIHDTLKGQTKPNLVTWGMRWLAPLIGMWAALSAQADPWATVRIALAGIIPVIVFIAALLFNNHSYRKISSFDIWCWLSSMIALIFWIFVKDPETAVLLAAIGDWFAALPTIFKAWKYPETESGSIFFMSLLGAILVLPSITSWDIVNSAFQIYLVAVNSILLFAIYRKKLLSYFF
jgi:hypothetical protein